MTEKLCAAIVGCGSISTQGYFPVVSEVFDLVATCDIIPDRAREMARIWGAPRSYGHMDDLLAHEKLDAVFILTSMSSHISLVQKAVDAGVHFLVQKPLTTDFEAGKKAVREAREKGLKGLVEPNYQQDPLHQKIREIIQEGHIGRVHYVRGFVERGFIPAWGGRNFYEREGGGILFDMGVYPISALTYLLGPAEAVTGMSVTSVPERAIYSEDIFTNWLKTVKPREIRNHNEAAVEPTIPIECEAYDNTMTLIRWPGECLGCIIANAVSFVEPPPNPRLVICGEKGSIAIGIPGSGAPLSVASLLEDSPYHVPAPPAPMWTGVGRKTADWYHFPADAFEPWKYTARSVRHLYDCIVHDRDPLPSLEWGLHVAEIMIKSWRAAETGETQLLETRF